MIMMYVPRIRIFNSDNLFLKVMKLLIIMVIILWILKIMIKVWSQKPRWLTPLLDRTPSDPSTMLNTMIQAKKITNHAGKNIVIFTAYQQLYRVALEIMWTEPNRFQSFISCLWHAVDHEFCRKYWGSNENQWHTSLVAKKGIWGVLKKC